MTNQGPPQKSPIPSTKPHPRATQRAFAVASDACTTSGTSGSKLHPFTSRPLRLSFSLLEGPWLQVCEESRQLAQICANTLYSMYFYALSPDINVRAALQSKSYIVPITQQRPLTVEPTFSGSSPATAFATLGVVTISKNPKKAWQKKKMRLLSPTAPRGAAPKRPTIAAPHR